MCSINYWPRSICQRRYLQGLFACVIHLVSTDNIANRKPDTTITTVTEMQLSPKRYYRNHVFCPCVLVRLVFLASVCHRYISN